MQQSLNGIIFDMCRIKTNIHSAVEASTVVSRAPPTRALYLPFPDGNLAQLNLGAFPDL